MTQLYAISPPSFVLDVFAEQLEQAFAGGNIAVFQLRMKEAEDVEIIAAIERLMPICHENECMFIVNDRPDLAATHGADGVHIGQKDMGYAEARAIIGTEKSVGVSCYDSKHYAFEAGEVGADYIAFGAFYPTASKPNAPQPPIELLEFWVENTIVPVVAIGGITPENAAPLVQAGADFIAVITGIWNHPQGPKAAVQAFHKVFEQ